MWNVDEDVSRGTLRFLSRIVSAAMSADGRLVAAFEERGAVNICVRDAQDWRLRHRSEEWGPVPMPNWLFPLAFTPDSRRLAVAIGDGRLKIYDTLTGREVGSPVLNIFARGCGFSRDGRWLRVGTEGMFVFLEATPLSEIKL
jgi:hypothetical protein